MSEYQKLLEGNDERITEMEARVAKLEKDKTLDLEELITCVMLEALECGFKIGRAR